MGFEREVLWGPGVILELKKGAREGKYSLSVGKSHARNPTQNPTQNPESRVEWGYLRAWDFPTERECSPGPP